MTRVLTNRWVLLCVLFVTIVVSSFLIYKNNFQPELVLLKNTTYYLPGQRNNCKWILQVENDLKNVPGETTEIRIGIPEVQADGYLSGRVEVGQHNNLMLAFIPPGSQKNKVPVILTADYSEQKLPIDFLRFRWVQSSTITILIFSSEERCIISRNAK
tara:strand:+ start:430 stop:903 length:474 start_codon:yes stop_codon:yes gene_type:complete